MNRSFSTGRVQVTVNTTPASTTSAAGALVDQVFNDILMDDATRQLGDLETIDAPGHNKPRPELEGLSDEDLSDSVNNPANGDKVTVKGNEVRDGNGRVKEMQKRGFGSDTEVPVDELPEDEPMAPWEDQ